MSCFDEIYGNDYYDFIVRNTEYLPPAGEGVCTLDGGNNLTILFASANMYPEQSVSNYNYNVIPKCYVPTSLEALEASGILQVQQTPSLALDGAGVLIGFLDSGIDTTHPAFLDETGNSRVVAVWNQNYQESMEMPWVNQNPDMPVVHYGRVYSGADIAAYGNGDETGHGTYVASVAAGSDRGSFSGAAPRADIAMVQLKDAKPYLKEYYFIPEETTCYQETDLILGIKFLNDLARMRNQSLVVCIALGTTMGSHTGNSPLDLYLNDVAVLYRRCIVCGAGNQAASRRHFYGNLYLEQNEDNGFPVAERLPSSYTEVEIVVSDNTCGFVMEQWAVSLAQYQVSIVSPTGTVLPPFGSQISGSQKHNFTLEGTTVTVDYSQPEGTTGNQLIFYRFITPSPGVWRVRVYSANKLNGVFHMYLAEESLQCGEVYFLTSNPDYTVVAPANARRVITVAGYNQRQNAILLESGRGYTLDGTIKPEFAAPAFQIDGAVAGGGDRPEPLQYEGRTGTSAASAVAAGAAALYMQWANKRGDIYINTTQIKNALVRGASRQPDELYPNRQWGDDSNIVSREARGLSDLFHRTSRLRNKIGRKNKRGVVCLV